SRKKTYLKAVNDVTFDVMQGETFGVVGESGCGKSTLGNVIMGLLNETSGEVIFDNSNWKSLSKKDSNAKRREIQMIFQASLSSLNPRMKGFDIIAEALITHKILKGKELRDEVYHLLNLVGLGNDAAKRFPHDFSGGQRPRIGIARAISLKPELIT